jgi:hypothetical protein
MRSELWVYFCHIYSSCKPVPAVAALSKAWVCGRSPGKVRIPPGHRCLCCECCVLSGIGLCERIDHSSRGVLLTLVCRCVWSRNPVDEEAITYWGAVALKTNKTTNQKKPKIPSCKKHLNLQFSSSRKGLSTKHCSLYIFIAITRIGDRMFSAKYYVRLWPVRLYRILCKYLVNDKIFGRG